MKLTNVASMYFAEAGKNGWDLTAWAALLAPCYLIEKNEDCQEAWEMVAIKAQKWL